MASQKKKFRPAQGELEIMAMLWREGPLTLAEAHERFADYGRPVSYPTMQTRLNRLAAKGMVRRSSDRPACYLAAISAEEVGVEHLDRWLHTTRQETVVPLVAHLISERPLTEQEIVELKRLLDEAERQEKTRTRKRS
ncbi:MAG: BlaI/MecI/CopY family transcriptional regulator [Thermoguttaceae bacterium]